MNDNTNTAMVTTEQRDELIPAFVMTITQARSQLAQLREFVKEVMVKDEDYGAIPGTDKPTLLKPGAEKLNEIYGYAPVTEVTHRVEDWENGFFHYECRTRLVSKRTGSIIAEGIGSCNSRESKYAGRWAWGNEVPSHLDKGRLKKREFNKKDGSGVVTKYLVPNDDIYSIVNTILKMSSKRSLIDATLRATRSSGLFTQDMEDLQDTHSVDVKPERPPQRPPERKATPRQPEQPSHIIDQEPTPAADITREFEADTVEREGAQLKAQILAEHQRQGLTGGRWSNYILEHLGKPGKALNTDELRRLLLNLECDAIKAKLKLSDDEWVAVVDAAIGENVRPPSDEQTVEQWSKIKSSLVDLAADRGVKV